MNDSSRPQPNFFIVGAPKAGTTSLYQYLAQHPAVYVSPIKEPNFFAPDVASATRAAGTVLLAENAVIGPHLDRALSEKRARSVVSQWTDYLDLFSDVRDETAIGEASVAYLASPSAAQSIHDRIPAAKIVMILRDPADRLFSYYSAIRSRQRTIPPFDRWAIDQAASEAGRGVAARMIWGGRYAAHLRCYRRYFPAEQIHVQLYDDFVRSPRDVLRGVFSFIGVDPEVPVDIRRWHNVTTVARLAGTGRIIPLLKRGVRAVLPRRALQRARNMSTARRPAGAAAGERARVIALYEDDIRELASLIHRDLSAWLDPNRSYSVPQPT